MGFDVWLQNKDDSATKIVLKEVRNMISKKHQKLFFFSLVLCVVGM